MPSSEGTPPGRDAWQVRSSRYVIDTAHLRIRADTVELPNGYVVDEYFVRESRGYSVVFAMTPEHQVLVVRQYKHGVGRIVLELPAGGIDKDEAPADCARRELLEETGYAGDEPEHLATFITDPTGSNGRFHLYIVRNARLTSSQHLDPTEDITVELYALPELLRLTRDGTIDVAPHVTAILTVFDRVNAGLLRL